VKPRPATYALWAALAVAVGWSAGCTVAHYLGTQPGTPIATRRPGLDRAAVEQVRGAPLREWRPNDQVVYRLYRYERAMGADRSAAGGVIFMDLITVGLFEGIAAAVPRHGPGGSALGSVTPRWRGCGAPTTRPARCSAAASAGLPVRHRRSEPLEWLGALSLPNGLARDPNGTPPAGREQARSYI